jgi:hypothetical protein
MNTNRLARHYGLLTPPERLALILAAAARGDEVERHRLVTSAPKVCYRVGDYFGLAMAFDEVSNWHYLEVLHLAGAFLQALGCAETWEEGELAERVLNTARLLGYVLRASLAGWRRFCANHQLPAEVLWPLLPGWETVRQAEREAGRVAFTEEGALRYWQGKGGGKPARVPTAEQVAAGLSELLKARAEWWG